MQISSTPYTALWYEAATGRVLYIDQTRLPWELVVREMKTFKDGLRAISDMEVRGAPLIGVAAAFAIYVGLEEIMAGPPPHPLLSKEGAGGRSVELALRELADRLIATRPTAVNLAYAVEQMLRITANRQPTTGFASPEPAPAKAGVTPSSRVTRHASRFLEKALEIRQAEIDRCRLIGERGLPLIREFAAQKQGEPVNILTHCNAGWLATVDYGTALAPVYLAHDSGIPVHVWVDETRPRNQGARLTVYELTQHGVPNTLIVDNAGGLLMQQGHVDLVLVGADRITANGDVVNKIGTYLKALSAFDNQVPFYVAAPSSTIDPDTPTGKEVTIEERGKDEVLLVNNRGEPIAPAGTNVHNPGFDITPARLISGYITETGIHQII